MRKLKLQMQISADGFVAGPEGQMDWMTWDWDEPLKNFVSDLTDSVDTILLGRKMTEGFISHWEAAQKNQDDHSQPFAQKMVNARKIVFSKTQKTISGINTSITGEDLAEVVKKLKAEPGKDIIVYGGAGFVSNLLREKLIDELFLFVNPAAIGNGLRIFSTAAPLGLIEAVPFGCGIVVLHYIHKI